MWLRIGDLTINLNQVNNISIHENRESILIYYSNKSGYSQIKASDYNMDIDILYCRILSELDNCKVVNL